MTTTIDRPRAPADFSDVALYVEDRWQEPFAEGARAGPARVAGGRAPSAPTGRR